MSLSVHLLFFLPTGQALCAHQGWTKSLEILHNWSTHLHTTTEPNKVMWAMSKEASIFIMIFFNVLIDFFINQNNRLLVIWLMLDILRNKRTRFYMFHVAVTWLYLLTVLCSCFVYLPSKNK